MVHERNGGGSEGFGSAARLTMLINGDLWLSTVKPKQQDVQHGC
jgi:hypothetical protein